MKSVMEILVIFILMKYFIILHHYLWFIDAPNQEIYWLNCQAEVWEKSLNLILWTENKWPERQVKLAPFNKLNIFFRLRNQFFSTVHSTAAARILLLLQYLLSINLLPFFRFISFTISTMRGGLAFSIHFNSHWTDFMGSVRVSELISSISLFVYNVKYSIF